MRNGVLVGYASSKTLGFQEFKRDFLYNFCFQKKFGKDTK